MITNGLQNKQVADVYTKELDLEHITQNENMFRRILEQSNDAISVFDTDGTLLLASDKVAKHWQVENKIATEMCGNYNILQDKQFANTDFIKNVKKVFDGETIEFEPTPYNGNITMEEMGIDHPPVNIIWTKTTGYPIMDRKGNVKNIVLEMKDITKENEYKLHYNNFFKNNISPVLWLNFDNPMATHLPVDEQAEYILGHMFIKDASWTIARLFGFNRRDEIIGMKMIDLYQIKNVKDPHPIKEFYKDFIINNYSINEVEIERPDINGSNFWLNINALGTIVNGYLTEIMSTVIDCTKQKKSQKIIIESRKQLLEAQSIAKIGSWDLDIRNNKLTWSDEVFRIFDLQPQEFKASYESFLDNIHPDDREKVNNAYMNSLKHKKPYEINHRILTKKGTLKYVNEKCVTYFDETGNPVRSIGTVQDITNNKKIETALEQSESRFKLLANLSQEGIVIHNNGRILEVNEAFCRISGYKAEEVIGNCGFENLLSKDSLKIVAENITSNKFIDYELEGIKKDGSKFWIIGEAHPITFKNQNARVFTFRDITEKKKIMEDLKIAKEKAEESDRLKTAFLASISHEIRTPLNAIVGFSNMIAESSNNPDLEKFSSIVKKQNDSLLQLVEDIIDFSKVEAGDVEITNEAFNLNELIQSLYDEFKSKTKPDVKLITKIPGDSLMVYSDKNRLNTIFSNLIRNAIKFTSKGYITIGYKKNKKSEINCFVNDTGIGIPNEDHEKIFNRFTKLDIFTEGTGLGLSIVKKNVELLNGNILLESEPGKGTNFYLNIPFEILNQDNSIEEKDIENNKSKEYTNNTLKNLTVLIAEDDVDNYNYINELVNLENIKTIHAENGIETVELCKTNSDINLVLMDIKMPILDGYEATKQIKEFKPDLPIIACTAYSIREDKIRAIEAGCDAHISKPIDKNELLDLIKKVNVKKL